MRRAPALFGALAIALSATTLSGLPAVALAKEGQVAIPAPEPGKCSLVWVGFENDIEKWASTFLDDLEELNGARTANRVAG